MMARSDLPDAGDLLKRPSDHPAAMSAFNFLEQSLTTHTSHSRNLIVDA